MRTLALLSAVALAACQQSTPANEDAADATASATPGAASGPASEGSDPGGAGSGAGAADPGASPADPADPAPDEDDGEDATPPADPAPAGDCPITRSANWQAFVNAMPGPNSNPRLIVTGQVTVPTGGYRLALSRGQVGPGDPPRIAVRLTATPPSGPATQAVETREVRGSFASPERVASVVVRCGSQVVARIRPVETAR